MTETERVATAIWSAVYREINGEHSGKEAAIEHFKQSVKILKAVRASLDKIGYEIVKKADAA